MGTSGLQVLLPTASAVSTNFSFSAAKKSDNG
jgi:hypothetical protein